MFELVLVGSLLLSAFGFYNMDNVEPKKSEEVVLVEEFADVDLENALKNQKRECLHDKKLVKGKRRDPGCSNE